MKNCKALVPIITAAMMLLGTSQGMAQRVYSTADGAINGYDPVSYFTEGKPVKGTNAYTYEWNNATWHFSSEENMRLFIEDPTSYAPQYGGYCAFGLANGYKVKTEPDAWAILDGRLYLNYDLGVQKDWNKDAGEYIIKADENWTKIRDQKVE